MYHSLVKEKEFQEHHIPQKAKRLSGKLSRTLAPFFVKDGEDSKSLGSIGFATWGQEEDEWKERQMRFEKITSMALEIKANSILSLEDYKMIIFAPGTPFDESRMTVESRDGLCLTTGNFKGRVVELCIEAAVFLCPKKELNDDVDLIDASFDTRNFSRTGNDQMDDVKVLLPAVVILRVEKSPD